MGLKQDRESSGSRGLDIVWQLLFSRFKADWTSSGHLFRPAGLG